VEAREVLVFRFNSILHESRLIAYFGFGSQERDSSRFASLSLLIGFVIAASDAGLLLFEALGLPGEEGTDGPAMDALFFGLIGVVAPADLPIVDHGQSAVGLIAVAGHTLDWLKLSIEAVVSGTGLQTMLGLVSLVAVPEEARVSLHAAYRI